MLQWLVQYWTKLRDLRLWVVEQVLWAEKEMHGKSGKEKRAVIVERLDDLVRLPFWLEWADGPLIGWLVDLACEKLNWLTDHDFENVDLNEAQKEKVADVLETPLMVSAAKGKSIDERLNELYAEYHIQPDRPDEPAQTPAPEKGPETPAPIPALKPGYITPHFRRREFACKCGCGADNIDPALAGLCETIRNEIGVPLIVNSGVRCEKHNAKVGGKPKKKDGTGGSFHMYGKAADLSCTLGARKLFEAIRDLYDTGKLPGLDYCLLYPTFVHIDIGKPRNQRFAVKRG